MGARRAGALQTHLRQRQQRLPSRMLPGSYSWPTPRAEAERRFAAGEPPRRVIDELRRRHARGAARAPSERKMRRWFTDARWLTVSIAFPDMRTGRHARMESRPRKRRAPPPGLNTRPFFPYDEWWERWRHRQRDDSIGP
jgi:hypothetical protein